MQGFHHQYLYWRCSILGCGILVQFYVWVVWSLVSQMCYFFLCWY